MLTSRLDAYISRYGDFCANNDDTTDYFTPLAHARGVIMDNYSIHHIVEVKDLLHQAGVLVLFLPYSPDLNPIEEAFIYIKTCLKKHDNLVQSGAPLTTIFDAAFESISSDHCNAWITHSGYQ